MRAPLRPGTKVLIKSLNRQLVMVERASYNKQWWYRVLVSPDTNYRWYPASDVEVYVH